MTDELNYVVYHWHFYLPHDNDTPLATIHDRLRNVIGTGRPTRTEEKGGPDLVVTGLWREWSLGLCCQTTPSVAQEAQALAARHDFAPPWDRVAKCLRRIELKSAPDFDAAEFDTYVGIHAELEEAFEDAIAVDAETGAVLE